jgi:hypothetical protein
MRVFSFEPEDVRERYRTDGWVHIRNGVDAAFLEELQAFVEHESAASHVEGRGISGTKQQAVFPLSEDGTMLQHLFDTIAGVCGLRRETMTLSERHIKAYDDDTPVDVPAHKDRLSSQVSVGISADVPAGSSLILYPDDDRALNPFNVGPALRQSLAPDQLPEVILREAHEVVIEDEPGDVMIFPGSTMWHRRRQGAGVVNLYLKFNDFDSDPLGEDPTTPARRAHTLSVVDGEPIANLRPVLARRLDTITRQQTRADGVTVVTADVWDARPVPLTDTQLTLLAAVDGSRSVSDLAAAVDGRDPAGVEADARQLAERGVIDLL